MNCEILETLYVKSNGAIPCNDDVGEEVILGNVDLSDPHWSIADVLSNDRYSQIRSRFAAGELPWGETCAGCPFLKRSQPVNDQLALRKIRKLQVETALACNLSCPCCNNQHQIKTRAKPFVMPLPLFDRLLGSLQSNGYSLGEIEYCGQGEPLMNREFPTIVECGRRYFPDAKQRLITNGNFDYWKSTNGTYIDEVFVSCDGFYQRSYEQYRVRGSVEKALKFIKDVPQTVGGKRQLLVWKYILFEFNDSDEELIAAQHAAQELGVDTLMFVFTHSLFKSTRYTPDTYTELPRLYPNVVTNLTPFVYNRAISFASPREDRSAARAVAPRRFSRIRSLLSRKLAAPAAPAVGDGAHITLDEVALANRSNRLSIRGWALAQQPITDISLKVDGVPLGTAKQGLPRPDVLEVFRDYTNRNSGFTLSAPVHRSLKGEHRITVDLQLEGSRRVERHFVYHFDDPLHLAADDSTPAPRARSAPVP